MSADKLRSLGINVRSSSGQTKTICPKCSHTRKSQNRREPCLSVNIDDGIYNCHNCGWQGSVSKKTYALPEWNEPSGVENLANSKAVEYLVKERGLYHDTLNAFKVTSIAQYVPKEQDTVETIAFPYYKNDVCVNIKYRSLNKGFKMVSNAELVMFNMNDLSKLNGTASSYVITEGEIDAMSIWQAGKREVMSVPNGASKGNNNLQYIDNSAEHLEKVAKFYLAMDKDEAGEKLMQELARRLGKDKCYIVDYPDGCKDANDVLLAYDEQVLCKCIEDARPMPIEGVVHAKDCYDDLMNLYKSGIDRGDLLGVEGLDDLVSFKTSMLYIVTGIPTHGKSSVVNWMEVMLAAKRGWKFAIFSPEHYPLEYLIYRYAEILLGKGFFRSAEDRMSEYELSVAVDFIHEHFFFIRPTDGMYTMSQLLSIAKSLVLRHGVKGFTIDPWNTIKHDYSTGLTETQYIEVALNELTIFKQVHDIAIFLVAHPRKMSKIKDMNHPMFGLHEVPTLYDISGSKSFYDKADVGITVYRNFSTGLTTAYVQKIKFKHLGEVGMQNLEYGKDTSRYRPVNEIGEYIQEEDNILVQVDEQQTVLSGNWFDDIEREKQFNSESSADEDDDLPF
jgi:twinkle protein